MSSQSSPSRDDHYVVPMFLLCVLCMAAAFSSVLYAIAARADIEELTVRLSSLESRGCCPAVVDEGSTTREKHKSHDEAQIRNRFKRSSPQNREFLNEDETEDVARSDRRRGGGGGRRRVGAREDPVLRGVHRMTGSSPTLALHFDGNTSKYSVGHRHYAGNGRLRHPDGIFRDWRMKEWSGRFNRQHRLQENDGTLSIRESGIYFVYAQVYYLDDHDINGFLVLVNETPVLQCTTMTHGGVGTKANTCFTGGMVELHAGDTVLLRDVEALRYSIFEPEKSFFGLFRVAQFSNGPREGP
ncbi:protein eiger [Hetaerina americana]|uniref:protein eiger n=1 Tax=Hetaerina americana TaxID=62018 RepID=UPI003A7F5825